MQEVTIRQWLVEDSHIVGPRNEQTLEYIAALTQDPYLLADAHGFFISCAEVRHDRRKILDLIAKAIGDKLSGNLPPEGSVLRVTGINERSEGQAKDDVNEIRTEIEEFFDLWQSYVDECNGEHPSVPLYFGRRFMVNPPAGDARRLLKQYNSSGKDSAVETLTSMRNVDTPVSGSIIVWGDNNV